MTAMACERFCTPIRLSPGIPQRVSESYRLGFTTCVVPKHCVKQIDLRGMPGLNLIGVQNLSQAIAVIR